MFQRDSRKLTFEVAAMFHALQRTFKLYSHNSTGKSYLEKQYFPKGNKICTDPTLPTMKSAFYRNSEDFSSWKPHVLPLSQNKVFVVVFP